MRVEFRTKKVQNMYIYFTVNDHPHSTEMMHVEFEDKNTWDMLTTVCISFSTYLQVKKQGDLQIDFNVKVLSGEVRIRRNRSQLRPREDTSPT